MNIYLYSCGAYLLTAALSLGMIGVIVVLNRMLGTDDAGKDTDA